MVQVEAYSSSLNRSWYLEGDVLRLPAVDVGPQAVPLHCENVLVGISQKEAVEFQVSLIVKPLPHVSRPGSVKC